MRAIVPATILSMLALAACGVADENAIELENVTIAEVAAAAGDAKRQQPGQWEVTSELVSLDLGAEAGAAPGAAMLKSRVGKPQTTSSCVSEADADKALVPSDIDPQGLCRFERFVMKGGTIESKFECREPGGGPGLLTIEQKGSYSDTQYELTQTTEQTGAGDAQRNRMTVRHVAKRTGECTPA